MLTDFKQNWKRKREKKTTSIIITRNEKGKSVSVETPKVSESKKYHVHTFKRLPWCWGDSSVSQGFAMQAQVPEFKSPALMSEAGYGSVVCDCNPNTREQR